MLRYFIRCPACGWESSTVVDKFEADRLITKHVLQEHPHWPPHTKFRRETTE